MRVGRGYMSCSVLWLSCALYKLAQALRPASFRPFIIQTNPNITIVGDNFSINGEPLQILSGSMHYFRVPAPYWRDRLRKMKAAGLNAVDTYRENIVEHLLVETNFSLRVESGWRPTTKYVEWSFHEPEERQYLFEGDRDIAAFIRLAAEEGLHVLLRPGTYICAERDMGGFPYWLLGKYPKIKLRTTDADFMAETKIWLKKLFEQVGALLFGNGGPIILVQVENEYGSYGSDMAYKIQLRDIILKHVGEKAILYTTDGNNVDFFKSGAIPKVLTTIDFGTTTTDIMDQSFQELRRFMPHGPMMNAEYYSGWMTHWGDKFQRVSAIKVLYTLEDMLNASINVNIYVFVGGTNFEFTSGANYELGTYRPDITSYDYDAPLNEAGDPTAKYFAFRYALARHNLRLRDIESPVASNKSAYGVIWLNKRFRLLSPQGRKILGKKYPVVIGSKLPTYEELRQRAGLMLYETVLGEGSQGTLLRIRKPRDRIHVFVDGELYGTMSWTRKSYTLEIHTRPNSVLSLLVENQGRISFGKRIHNYKGILSKVKIDGKVLNGSWSVTGFPLQNLEAVAMALPEDEQDVEGPTLFDGYFMIPENVQPQDTFIDTTTWGKGYIWVNGHNLGRYWPMAGPQVTLYVPGCWLRARNHLQVLELDQAPTTTALRSIDYPILDSV